MKCPRDGAQMETSRHEAGFEIDTCPTCKGVWLDKGELDALKSKVEKSFKPGEMKVPEDYDFGFSRRMQASQTTIACPRCNADMDVKEYHNWSDIMIDVCPAGCGLWLDNNELTAITVFFQQNLERGGGEDPRNTAMWANLVDLFGG